MKIREKDGTGTLDIHPLGPDGGVAVHTDGDHVCFGEYGRPKQGQNLAGLKLITIDEQKGEYQAVDTGGGAKLCAGGGPAQVATEEYRESWERTFGARGGVS